MVTIALDRKSWLLSGVEIENVNDTAAVFTESYDHYTDIAGIPFPQEFKATFRGAPILRVPAVRHRSRRGYARYALSRDERGYDRIVRPREGGDGGRAEAMIRGALSP